MVQAWRLLSDSYHDPHRSCRTGVPWSSAHVPTYLVYHPCSVSVTAGDLCFSLQHCPFPALWTMRAVFKMLDKSISLFTPMCYLPRGLVIDVWSCHFSSLRPALSAISKTKFLTSMKEFICQRTYLSSLQKHKIACIHHQTANPGSEIFCLRGRGRLWDSASG